MLLVVAHDAGGAEILSSFVHQTRVPCIYTLEGPALPIFERKLGSLPTLPLHIAIDQAASLLCGTSWQSDLEFTAIRLAQARGLRATAFLDHWVNYRERFTRGSETHFPDEILVGDDIAKSLAEKALPGIQVRQIENPYFADLRAELAALSPNRADHSNGISILFVSEPIREHMKRQFGNERHLGYVEEEALSFFLENAGALGSHISKIVIRPHPSESTDKYSWAEKRCDLPLIRGGTQSLLQEIADCDVVVGCESMAMVIGLLAAKRVVSCTPPSGHPCRLPYPEIEHLTEITSSPQNSQSR